MGVAEEIWMESNQSPADVCLILEGSYPFVSGGVSSWTHELIKAQSHLSFHLVFLVAPDADLTYRYELPDNVVGTTKIVLQRIPKGDLRMSGERELLARLEEPLLRLLSDGGLEDLDEVRVILSPHRGRIGANILLDSRYAWEMLVRMYNETYPETSFLDYFWSWRALFGGIYSVLLAEMPRARIYHSPSTGYAGLFAARAGLETGCPVLLTEHGIYTNERRIEIAMANWFYEMEEDSLSVHRLPRQLSEMWVKAFTAYSRCVYDAAYKIITLFEGNQVFQLMDGAQREKMMVIPNGVDIERYARIPRKEGGRPPTIALIGRVVQIKDVKTFIRSCSTLQENIPDLRALIMGSTEEEEQYFQECLEMVNHMGLENIITFTGQVRLEEYLGGVDVVVLTSISEGQPLVILEAGAAGIPVVATNVGACREILLSDHHDTNPPPPGGSVTPLSNPAATAQAVERLLTDPFWYQRCSEGIRERIRRYYNKTDFDRTYRDLYEQCRRRCNVAVLEEAS